MSTIASLRCSKKIESYYYKIFLTNTNTQQIVCHTVAATQILILIGKNVIVKIVKYVWKMNKVISN